MSIARIPFSHEEHSAIQTLTGSMLFLIIVNMIFGLLGVLGGCCSVFGIPARAAIHPMMGVATFLNGVGVFLFCALMVGQAAILIQTRGALNMIVHSDNQDQALFSEVFAKLRFYFMLEAACFLVSMLIQCGAFLTQIFGPVGQVMGAGA